MNKDRGVMMMSWGRGEGGERARIGDDIKWGEEEYLKKKEWWRIDRANIEQSASGKKMTEICIIEHTLMMICWYKANTQRKCNWLLGAGFANFEITLWWWDDGPDQIHKVDAIDC